MYVDFCVLYGNSEREKNQVDFCVRRVKNWDAVDKEGGPVLFVKCSCGEFEDRFGSSPPPLLSFRLRQYANHITLREMD